MNTLGKILVALNFVVALMVAGFITYNFAAREKSHHNETQLREELLVKNQANRILTDSRAKQQELYMKKEGELEEKKLELAKREAEWSIKEAELLKSFKDAEDRGKLAEVNFEKALVAMERMKKEVEGLKLIIEDREDRVVKTQVKLKDTTDLAMSLDRDLKFSNERNQILLGRVQELEKYIAELVSGTKADVASALPNNPNGANPPQKFMRGVIEKVDPTDKALVRISLGTDHGLQKNQTLEVYRLGANPEYLGMIRIEDAHHHTSVARQIRTPGLAPKTIREGDAVSSSLTPR